MLSEKFGFDSPVLSQKPVELGKPVVEALAPVSSPVQASAPTPSESPKPKKVIVIKKSPDGKMKLVKDEKQRGSRFTDWAFYCLTNYEPG